mmetsp:Transcript_20844/g.53217  ORF Transcript_20844/g.53217 Transcript_20844/m.53217 type:complete len:483 (+) Transcript_20844:246-1694(+)
MGVHRWQRHSLVRPTRHRASLRSDLLEDGRRVRVALYSWERRELLQLVDILLDDLQLARCAEVKVVLLGPLAEHWVQRLVLIARHNGEEMVLELPLHAPPQDVGEPVGAHGVACRAELRLGEIILAKRIIHEDLLGLMSHRHDGGGEQTGEPDAKEDGLQGQKGAEGSPVHRKARRLLPLLVLEHVADRVEAPVQEEHRERDGPVDVLEVAQPRVFLRIRLPQVDGWLECHILIVADLVRQRVVHVVLHRPPSCRHATNELTKSAHRHAEGRAAVHVIVRQPAGESVTHRERKDRAEAGERVREFGQILSSSEAERPRHQLLHFTAPVGFEPAVLLELLPELAEGIRGLNRRRHVSRGLLAPRHTLDHPHCLGRVEAMHDLRRISILVCVDPVSAGRVGRAPVCQIIPLIVDADVQAVALLCTSLRGGRLLGNSIRCCDRLHSGSNEAGTSCECRRPRGLGGVREEAARTSRRSEAKHRTHG